MILNNAAAFSDPLVVVCHIFNGMFNSIQFFIKVFECSCLHIENSKHMRNCAFCFCKLLVRIKTSILFLFIFFFHFFSFLYMFIISFSSSYVNFIEHFLSFIFQKQREDLCNSFLFLMFYLVDIIPIMYYNILVKKKERRTKK